MATGVVERFGGEVPSAMEDLVTLPGRRVARRPTWCAAWPWTCPGLPSTPTSAACRAGSGSPTETDPVKAELALNAMVPAQERGVFSLRLILHGRAVCVARKPRCGDCVLADFCPSAGIG